MPQLSASDLRYKYSWTAVEGDDPSKVKEDATRFSRNEGYEVLHLLNSLQGAGGADLPIRTRLICEWMINEKLPSNIQGRNKVISWIVENFTTMEMLYPN
jgi:hypothetical protein